MFLIHLVGFLGLGLRFLQVTFFPRIFHPIFAGVLGSWLALALWAQQDETRTFREVLVTYSSPGGAGPLMSMLLTLGTGQKWLDMEMWWTWNCHKKNRWCQKLSQLVVTFQIFQESFSGGFGLAPLRTPEAAAARPQVDPGHLPAGRRVRHLRDGHHGALATGSASWWFPFLDRWPGRDRKSQKRCAYFFFGLKISF